MSQRRCADGGWAGKTRSNAVTSWKQSGYLTIALAGEQSDAKQNSAVCTIYTAGIPFAHVEFARVDVGHHLRLESSRGRVADGCVLAANGSRTRRSEKTVRVEIHTSSEADRQHPARSEAEWQHCAFFYPLTMSQSRRAWLREPAKYRTVRLWHPACCLAVGSCFLSKQIRNHGCRDTSDPTEPECYCAPAQRRRSSSPPRTGHGHKV